MRYLSTRGGVKNVSFREAVMMGLASDGGLLVPERIPDIKDQLQALKDMDYVALAEAVMAPFIDDIPAAELKSLIDRSYSTFDHPLVTPLVPVDDFHVLELFHGPTLAFKDVALQFLGNVFEHILKDEGYTLNILGATSGDTGSAAIAGVRGKENINIFIMFPEGRTSLLQEMQMTTVLDDNVQNLSIEGSFDDCQSILKAVFNDLPFKEAYHLGAVNSVNWARVLAQVVYYFSAWSQLGGPPTFDVAVPTGNFGNIFAGYVARKMGLPIRRLILATNQNDILHRFFSTGRYERGEVHFSESPAMDIQVASNFERYLYFRFDQQTDKVEAFMQDFAETGSAVLNMNTASVDEIFVTGSCSDEQTLATIAATWDQSGYLADPHTAVGIHVARQFMEASVPLVCLSTAHPAKFDTAMHKALGDSVPVTHPSLEELKTLPARKAALSADAGKVKQFIEAFNA